MSKTLKYLLDKEWSMGNGQCPECCGVHTGWLGHPLYLTSKNIGHKKECVLAASIKENKGDVIYKGEFKSSVEYWNIISENGCFSTEIKPADGQISEGRQRMVDADKEFSVELSKSFLGIKNEKENNRP